MDPTTSNLATSEAGDSSTQPSNHEAANDESTRACKTAPPPLEKEPGQPLFKAETAAPSNPPSSPSLTLPQPDSSIQLQPAPTTPSISPTPPTDPKTARLHTQIRTLETQISQATTDLLAATSQLKNPDASATVKTHIALLHRYNETKDIGMGLLGLISEQRGVRLKEVLEEWGVGERD